MMHRKYIPATLEERRRIERMLALGCVLTLLETGVKVRAEVHHITECRKRLGHNFSIPLSPWYHRGDPGRRTEEEMLAEFGPSLAHGSKVFVREHKITELALWEIVQEKLGLPAERPTSKILPRRNVA